MWWKGFTAESDTWEKEKDLKNAKELVDDFEGRIGAKIRWQEKVVEKKREKEEYRRIVKIEEVGLSLFYFIFYFYFIFNLFFHFLFLEQLRLGLIGHNVTTVTWWQSHKTDHKTWENLIEDSRINDVI